MESAAIPGAGACGGQYTANTMSIALEFLGISPAGLNGIPALNRGKGDAAEECGRLVMQLVRDDVRPSHIITRDAIENAAASVAATGGSTNGVLHLLAIAAELGIPFSIDEFDVIATRTPIVASLKPGGEFVATDMFDAGGVALVARELKKRDLIHSGAVTVDGRTLGQIADDVVETPGQPVVVPITAPLKASRRPGDPAREPLARRMCGQARRARAAAPSRPGAGVRHRGGRVRSGQGALDRGRRRGRDPLRGPGRRPGDAGDAARDRSHRGRGARRGRRAGHRRPLLGRDPRPDGRAHHPRGCPRRPDRGAAATATSSCSTSRRVSCGSSSPTTRSQARLRDWTPPPPRYTTGVLAKYASLVSSASEGAVTRPR